MALMDFHAVLRHVERHVRHVEKIIGEILLDDVPLVTEAYDEIVDPVV